MQFGQTLRRILFQIYHADPRWGPVYISKVNISDEFYNISVNTNDTKAVQHRPARPPWPGTTGPVLPESSHGLGVVPSHFLCSHRVGGQRHQHQGCRKLSATTAPTGQDSCHPHPHHQASVGARLSATHPPPRKVGNVQIDRQ